MTALLKLDRQLQGPEPVVLVTGGGAGIGQGIARHFAAHGYRVVVAELNLAAAESTAAELPGALAIETDIREEASVEACIARVSEHFGRLDCLVNNAGVEVYRAAPDYTAAEFDRIVGTNLRGTFLMTKYAHPLLQASRGSVVNISSVQGFANERHISVYAATKAALLGYTRATALDLAPEGIRVNAVCPGAIHTAMTDAFLADKADPAGELTAITRHIPLARMGTPADIAAVVYFLASSAAAYITGTSIVADGGLLARLAL